MPRAEPAHVSDLSLCLLTITNQGQVVAPEQHFGMPNPTIYERSALFLLQRFSVEDPKSVVQPSHKAPCTMGR
jgi:hypothetical protein